MAKNLSASGFALTYVPLVLVGAFIANPEPTGALPALVAVVALAVAGYAFRDGSIRALGYGIAALYAFGICASIGVSIARERLLESGLYGGVLLATAALSIGVLCGTYLAARRREPAISVPLIDR